MRMIGRAIWVALIYSGLIMGGCVSQNNPASSPTQIPVAPEIGTVAPNFTLSTLNGQSISLSDLQGKTVLLNFWTTWCTYCVAEMPYIQQISEKWTSRGLVVLAIDVEESLSTVSNFAKEKEIWVTILLDSTGKVASKYRIPGFPTTFFIDKDGVIMAKKIGSFLNAQEIEAMLSKFIT